MFFSLKYLYLLFKRNWKRGFIMRSKRLKITFWLCLSIKSFQLKPAFLSKENQQRIFRCTLKVSFFCKLFIIYFYILPLFIYLAASVVFISIFKQLKLNANFFQNFAFFPHSSSLTFFIPSFFYFDFSPFFLFGLFYSNLVKKKKKKKREIFFEIFEVFGIGGWEKKIFL